MLRRINLTSILIAAFAAAALAGCKQDAGSAPAPQLPQVEVISVTTQTVPDEPEFIGEAQASRPVEIRSQVTGILKAVLYQEGRDVKKGDRLYQIDPVPFQAAVASAKAKIAQAEAKVVQAKQDLVGEVERSAGCKGGREAYPPTPSRRRGIE